MTRLVRAAFTLITLSGAHAETLRYTVNWPSGIALGDAQLVTTVNDDASRKSDFALEASLPGFPLIERASSVASSSLCSVELKKEATRGKRTINETTSFEAGTATRKTSKGGESKLPAGTCPRDALTYLQFLRRELAAGRVPPPQQVWFGAAYDIRASFVGTQKITVQGQSLDVDRVAFALKGPVANVNFEIAFARDAVRTPVLVKVPLGPGTFTMELTR